MITLESIQQKFSSGSRGSSQISPKDTGEWDQILKGIDKDGSGKINFKQFEYHMLQMIRDDPNYKDGRSFRSASTAEAWDSMSNNSMTSTIRSTLKDIKNDIIDAGSKMKDKVRTRKIKAKLVSARGSLNQDGKVDWARLKDHMNRSETFWPELQEYIRSLEDQQELIDYFNNIEGVEEDQGLGDLLLDEKS